jgi:hypothetical protein
MSVMHAPIPAVPDRRRPGTARGQRLADPFPVWTVEAVPDA